MVEHAGLVLPGFKEQIVLEVYVTDLVYGGVLM